MKKKSGWLYKVDKKSGWLYYLYIVIYKNQNDRGSKFDSHPIKIHTRD